MMNKSKNSLKHGSALILTLMLLSLTKGVFANYLSPDPFYNILTAFQDTTRPKANKTDTIPRRTTDSLLRRATDTIPGRDSVTVKDTFDLKISKDTLSAPVTYTASDSIVMTVKDKKIILFSKANVKYTDVETFPPTVSSSTSPANWWWPLTGATPQVISWANR
jgi:LPS-assembly protein